MGTQNSAPYALAVRSRYVHSLLLVFPPPPPTSSAEVAMWTHFQHVCLDYPPLVALAGYGGLDLVVPQLRDLGVGPLHRELPALVGLRQDVYVPTDSTGRAFIALHEELDAKPHIPLRVRGPEGGKVGCGRLPEICESQCPNTFTTESHYRENF